MPVVKNLDLEATTEQTESVARVTVPGLTKTNFDEGREPDAEPGAGVGLYLTLIVAAGIVLRIFLAMLGPGMEPGLALDAAAQQHLQLGETIVDHQRFALPVDLDNATFQPGPAAPPHTVAQAAQQFTRLQEQRGEVDAVFTDGLRPETGVLPGMSVLLGAFELTGLPITWLILAQSVVGGLLAWPAFLVVSGMLKKRGAALLVAALIAIHPGMITAALTLDGTVWVAALLLLALVPVAQTWFTSGLGLGAAGVALGVASLIQPWAVFVAPVAAGWRTLKQRSWSTAFWCAVMVLLAAAPPAAWIARNHQLGRGLVLTTHSPIDRAFGVPAEIAATDRDGAFRYDRPAAIADAWQAFNTELQANPDATAADTLNAFAWERTTADPLGYARYQLHHARDLTLDHSAEILIPQLGIPYEPAGLLAGLIGQPTATDATDPVARWITEVWIGLNLALLAGAVVGLTFGVARRQFLAVTTVLGFAAVWLVVTPSWAGESARLPLLVIQGLAIAVAALPAAPRKPKKAKLGDFTAAAPDAGFTIGPRGESTATLGPATFATPAGGVGTDEDDNYDEPQGGRPI